jgi:hypothetical protein
MGELVFVNTDDSCSIYVLIVAWGYTTHWENKKCIQRLGCERCSRATASKTKQMLGSY